MNDGDPKTLEDANQEDCYTGAPDTGETQGVATDRLVTATPEETSHWLSSLSTLIVRLNSVHVGADARGVLLAALREITGAEIAWVCDFDPDAMELRATQIDACPSLLEKALPLIAPEARAIRVVVGEREYDRIVREIVSLRRTLAEVSFGQISPEIGSTVQALLGIDHFIGLANAFGGRLYGTTVLGMGAQEKKLPAELLMALAQITAAFLSRWQTEVLLKRSESRYKDTVSMISDIIWRYEVDEQGDFVIGYISPVADRLLGLAAGSIGDSFERFFSYVHPEDLSGVRETLMSGLTSHRGEMLSVEYRLCRPDGTLAWVRSRGSAHEQRDGHVAIFGTITDITEQRHLAQTRVKLQSQLSQAQKMESVGRLAGGVAHDFNNMLAVILSYSKLALEELEPSSQVASDLREIRDAAEHSAELTRQLLAFARKRSMASSSRIVAL